MFYLAGAYLYFLQNILCFDEFPDFAKEKLKELHKEVNKQKEYMNGQDLKLLSDFTSMLVEIEDFKTALSVLDKAFQNDREIRRVLIIMMHALIQNYEWHGSDDDIFKGSYYDLIIDNQKPLDFTKLPNLDDANWTICVTYMSKKSLLFILKYYFLINGNYQKEQEYREVNS